MSKRIYKESLKNECLEDLRPTVIEKKFQTYYNHTLKSKATYKRICNCVDVIYKTFSDAYLMGYKQAKDFYENEFRKEWDLMI